jgi:hypothetical protein
VSHAEDLFRRAAPSDEEAERQREIREVALEAAYDAAGGVVFSLLEELGDTNAKTGTRKVISSLVAAGAPPERMTDLAYLARDRVRAFGLRGGRILDTQVGFYIMTLCNLAKEARRTGWDVQKIAATDRRRHERIIRRSGAAIPQTVGQPARRGERRPKPPTPAEAGALVREPGQQPATYAEAQAQVHQWDAQRQSREAQQRVVRQQAQLYQQLAQAAQVLKTFPEGSRAWERAHWEQQELEHQMAALRQQSGAAPTTAPAASPEGGQQPRRSDRSERDYRDAISYLGAGAWVDGAAWVVWRQPTGLADWVDGGWAAGVSPACSGTGGLRQSHRLLLQL